MLLQKLHVVETELGQDLKYKGGWGYIEFKDHEAAVEGMRRQVLPLSVGHIHCYAVLVKT